jgi:MinD-like ATPase involved in chromosome partitioning or flagellar assembly
MGLKEVTTSTLNDFLWGKAAIENVAVDVSGNVGLPEGRLYLLPCSMHMGDITRILKEGYDVKLLNQGFREIKEKLGLDYLVIDTHPGLNEETLLSIAISDALFVILRPDQQDFQGTSVTVEVARRLKVKNLYIIVNKLLSFYDPEQIKKKVEDTYGCPVAAVLPLNEKLVELGSGGLFLRTAPEDGWSKSIRAIADKL